MSAMTLVSFQKRTVLHGATKARMYAKTLVSSAETSKWQPLVLFSSEEGEMK